jgi:hypothetical protein
VETFLREGFEKAPERLEITKLTGDRCTLAAVLDYYRNLKTGPNESLLFYYAGHGATRFGAGSDIEPVGHLFGMARVKGKNAPIYRAEVRALMQGKRPRLSILLSDTCSKIVGLPPEIPRDLGKPDWQVIRALFLVPRGTVDINSVTEGESAHGSDEGGYFTAALTTVLREPLDKLRRPGEKNLLWHDVVPPLHERAQEQYASYRRTTLAKLTDAAIDGVKPEADREQLRRVREHLRRQPYQTVRVYQLPEQWRFGARLLANGGDGVKVAFVYEGSPAAAAGFKPGDVIRKVGARRITSADDFQQALGESPREAVIEFRRGDAVQRVTVNPAARLPGYRDL